MTTVGPTRRGAWWSTALAALLVVVGAVASATQDVLLVASGLASGAVAVVVSRRLHGPDRAAWLLVGLAQVANGVGNVAIVLDHDGWFAQADLGSSLLFTAAGACMVAGALTLALAARDRPGVAWLVLDVLTVTGALTLVGWAAGLQRLLGDGVGGGGDLGVVLGCMGVAGSTLAVLVGALTWRSRPVGGRAGARLVVAAIAMSWLGDTGLAGRLPVPDSWLVLSWVASSCLCLAGAAWAAGDVARPVGAGASVWAGRVVYGVVVAVGASVPASVLLSGGTLDPTGERLLAAVAVVLVLRLLTLALDAQRLTGEVVRREQLYRSLVQTAPDLIVRTDLTGRIGFVSTSVRAMLGTDAEQVLGRSASELVVPADAGLVDAAFDALAHEPNGTRQLEVRLRDADGRLLHLEAVASRVGDDVVFVVRDATERVRLQQELLNAAYRDALTGLPNRQAFDVALAARLRGGDGDQPVALAFFDLDGFKSVNDTSGHSTGDRVLAQAGERLCAATRPGDLAARFGGDEFTVLLAPGTGVEDAVALAERTIAALGEPYLLDGREFVLGATAGVAVGEVGSEPGDLVRDADLAMYRAKEAGRARVRVFEPKMLEELRRRVHLEQRLHHAIVEDGLSLRYQPVVDLGTGRVPVAEALLRWTEGDRSVLGAAELVALAESRGRIQAIGGWVLQQSVARAASWRALGHQTGVAVNLSVQQLADDGFVATVDRVLRAHGLPPEQLTLELTESVLIERAGSHITTLERLVGLGVHLAVDDFGTGYSALEYLRRLPVDQLKVDRAFVQGLGQLDDVDALLRRVVGLGRALGLSVTVEGVEGMEQVRLLREMDVQRGQGFALARPLSEVDLLAFLDRGPVPMPPRLHVVGERPDAVVPLATSSGVRQLDQSSGM
ncbi:putative bifunctional diguanylate cyclase/phosphodiesterase [Angustibacter aerolatus]